MKRILVPTDFSDCANAASDMAIQLACKSEAEIIYLHLAIDHYPPAIATGTPVDIVAHEVGQERYKLQQLVSKAEASGVKSKYELVLGNGQEEIEDYSEPFDADWLIMGSHGATGIRETIIGSRTQHVIRKITIPCIVVKYPTKKLPTEILFASTFKKDNPQAFQEVLAYCRLIEGNLNLLYLIGDEDEISEDEVKLELSKLMNGYPNIKYTINSIKTNDKEFGIAQFAKTIGAEMIAIEMESRSIFGRVLNPILAEQLINHSPLPILVGSSK